MTLMSAMSQIGYFNDNYFMTKLNFFCRIQNIYWK